jgi:hypothetical protein
VDGSRALPQGNEGRGGGVGPARQSGRGGVAGSGSTVVHVRQ